MKKIILAFLFLLSGYISSQSVKVIETAQIQISSIDEAYFPRFSKDDSKILFSTANYKGLYSYNINTKKLVAISERNGAGYNPLIVDDEMILFRTFNIDKGRKYYSVESINTKTGAKEILESKNRRISIPNQLVGKELTLIENSVIKRKPLQINSLTKTKISSKAIYVENDNLIIVENGERRILNPLGKGVYVWESISKDGNQILFTFGNKGAFVCDWEGNILANIKEAHYPKFSHDGKYISFMKDKDDGYSYISSDIYIYSIELDKSFQVTNSKDRIEMYAEWSNNGNYLVYHTINGEIYISTLQYEN